MEAWLKRNGFVYKRPKNIPQRVDTLKQQAFIEQYLELKQNLKETEAIFFMDEVHPSHQAHAAYGWMKKGQEKTLKTSVRQEKMHVVGAIELKGMTLIIPNATNNFTFEPRQSAENRRS